MTIFALVLSFGFMRITKYNAIAIVTLTGTKSE